MGFYSDKTWDLNGIYHLVICYIAMENGPVEIGDLPSCKMVIFHSHVTVYQRVSPGKLCLFCWRCCWIWIYLETIAMVFPLGFCWTICICHGFFSAGVYVLEPCDHDSSVWYCGVSQSIQLDSFGRTIMNWTCRISQKYDFDVPEIQRSTGWIIAPLVLSKHLIAEATHSSISPFSTGQLQFLKLNSHNLSYDAAWSCQHLIILGAFMV